MPEEEKKHEPARFKAVTEELTAPEPVVEKPQEITPVPEITTQDPVEKEILAVKETNNITPEIPKPAHDAGVFVKFFLLTFFATVLALALVGGIFVFLSGTKNQSSINTSTPTPAATALTNSTPTPVPTANIDLTTYKVSVLNGTGGIGIAGKARDILEKAGFKVAYIGNADNFNFTDTLIQTKNNVAPVVVSSLKNALSSNYSVKVGDYLDPASTYDIVVTVGSK